MPGPVSLSGNDIQSLLTPGHCVWLIPSDPTALQATITTASQAAGTPAFEPHITLIGAHPIAPQALEDALHDAIGASTLQRAVAGGDNTGSGMQLLLDPPIAGDRYFQCVMAPVNPESAGALVALRTALSSALGVEALPYFPHLSLAYGDLEVQRREEIAKSVGSKGKWPVAIEIEEACVVDINGGPEDWKIVSRVRL